MNYPYQTLAYVGRLSFRDPHGLEAIFQHYQRLRVLSADLDYVVHEIWGDGDQLHEYVSDSAKPIQLARMNGRDVVVGKLKQTAKAGDEIEIYSTRLIHHAFKDDRRFYWEYSPITPTVRARVATSFPLGRDAEAISVGASQGSRTPHVLRPATKELVTTVDNPTLRSIYRMAWSW